MSEVYIHPSAVIDNGAIIGAGTKVWHFCHVMPGAQLGANCILGQNVFVGPGVQIGNRVKIQNNVSVYSGVTLEDGVFVGPSAVFTNVMNPRGTVERKEEFLSTLVRAHASVGANATIVCGVTLGEYCFIGAGAVVTRDVPAFALVVGNPARKLGWVSRRGIRLDFDKAGVAICPEDGSRYILEEGLVRTSEGVPGIENS